MSNYWKTLAISLDQFGMALCGGNEDTTISATTGYFSNEDGGVYWESMRKMIDFTFYPVDNKHHCIKAYRADPNEEYRVGSKTALLILTFVFCVPIALILWTRFLLV